MLASNNANHRMAQILVEAGADLNQASSQVSAQYRMISRDIIVAFVALVLLDTSHGGNHVRKRVDG
jgi:hypothetical protein